MKKWTITPDKTLTELFLEIPVKQTTGLHFIQNQTQSVFTSYAELHRNALALLGYLKTQGLHPKDELIFQIEDNRWFVYLFWACILGGIIPVPVACGGSHEHQMKVFRILPVLTNPRLITTSGRLEKLTKQNCAEVEAFKPRILIFDPSLVDSFSGIETAVHPSDANDIAFIQFSSGSTGEPKGVTLTHKNLGATILGLILQMEVSSQDATLSWLPLTHDLGLIGYHLMPTLMGINQSLMDTNVFIKHPLLWLSKASEMKATILVSPNFGFHYFLKFFTPQQADGWDLSSIRVIMNAAEPISPRLCDQFMDALQDRGLKHQVMRPGYGLAEASLGVSFTKAEEPYRVFYLDRKCLGLGQQIRQLDPTDIHAAAFVTVGPTVPGTSARISGQGSILPENTIGELEIKGENVTSGYYNNPEATRPLFTSDGWLKTGDLGFIHGQDLVITGRIKEVLFAAGQNYYAHDIERTIADATGMEETNIVAVGCFNQDTQGEEVLVFMRYKKKELIDFLTLEQKIKEVVVRELGLTVDHVLPIKQIPKTTSGKVQRYKLREQYQNGDFSEIIARLAEAAPSALPGEANPVPVLEDARSRIRAEIKRRIEKQLGFPVKDPNQGLVEAGLNSVKVPLLIKELENAFQLNLPVSLVFDYPTVHLLTDYIHHLKFGVGLQPIETRQPVPAVDKDETDWVAVIGMACRFPGQADSPDRFWKNLSAEVDTITEIPGNRWDARSYYDPTGNRPGSIRTLHGGFLEHIDRFDAAFFGIPPVEAREMDPQHRMLLQVSYEALENAALSVKKLGNTRTGVFIGLSANEYAERAFGDETSIGTYAGTGNLLSSAAGRIAYFLGTHGPALVIDTACSSSLVCIDQAVLNLRQEKCDLVIAGAVNLLLSPKSFISLTRLNALAPDGRCKVFDASADGYGRSEGCAAFVLKRYGEALKDRDPVLAILIGSAVNHDGKSSGFTVPNGPAQEAVIRSALQDARLAPKEIDYVETHGTGTRLGDPQEINALANIFQDRKGQAPLLVGSVKSNIGHTESAAGLAGLMKVVLALQHEQIPANLHFKNPNELIPWRKIPVSVAARLTEWKHTTRPRRAGISSFGLTGTNAHLIVQEPPRQSPAPASDPGRFHLLTLSAKTDRALAEMIRCYAQYLAETPHRLADICFTSNATRSFMQKRAAFVANSKEDLREQLNRGLATPGSAEEVDQTGLQNLAACYLGGKDPDWQALHANSRARKVPLPNYPFSPETHWIENKPALTPDKALVCNQELSPAGAPSPVPLCGRPDKEQIEGILKEMIQAVSGLVPENIAPEQMFYSLGLDSLMLAQVKRKLEETFRVNIPLEAFLADLNSIAKLSRYLQAQPGLVLGPAGTATAMPVAETLPAGHVQKILQGRFQALHQFLDQSQKNLTQWLQAQLALASSAGALQNVPAEPVSALENRELGSGSGVRSTKQPIQNFRFMKTTPDSLTGRQSAFVEAFIRSFNQKTARSKESAQKYRSVLADWIATLNFRTTLKELIYPIVSSKAEGSRIWDLDGNEYVDMAMGFGADYFGHRPAFIIEALQKQIQEGYELATQTRLAGEVATLVAEMTGVERVVFSNTGTEAVMAALRLARAHTGRDLIVRFAGSYHGSYDGILAEADENGVLPVSRGIPQALVQDVLVLPYGSRESLETIRNLGGRLAGVLVEAVQSRRPGFQPRDYLHQLRALISESGAAFILDDVFMGFRIQPGGTQAFFGLQADIVTYGKVIGGGLPMGLVAGKAKYLDAMDGGSWQYGDSSYPAVETVFFGGTFCRHPLAVAAAHATLLHMKEQGPALQERVNRLAQDLADRLNAFFKKEEVPIQVNRFGSVFRFESFGPYDLNFLPIEMDLFFFLLMFKGVYTWERRICCLSTAHTEQDTDRIIAAVIESIRELRQGGFDFRSSLSGPGGARPGALEPVQTGSPASTPESKPGPTILPMTAIQKRLFAVNQWPQAEKAYHLTGVWRVQATLDPENIKISFRRLIERHEILRTGFKQLDEELVQEIHPPLDPVIRERKCTAAETEVCIREAVTPFDLARAPLFRIILLHESSGATVLVLDFHHLITDGLSANILLQEWACLCEGQDLPAPTGQARDGLVYEKEYFLSERFKKQEAYWLNLFADNPPACELPLDYPRPLQKRHIGAKHSFSISGSQTSALKNLAKKADATLFMVLLSAFNLLLYRLTGRTDIVIGSPAAVRETRATAGAIGMFTNTLALRNTVLPSQDLSAWLQTVRDRTVRAYAHHEYPFERLAEKLKASKQSGRHPLFDVIFVYEKPDDRRFRAGGLLFEPLEWNPHTSMFDLDWECIEAGGALNVNIYYDTDLFRAETVTHWAACFRHILKQIVDRPQTVLRDIDPLAPTEREKILNEFGCAAPAAAFDHTILEHIEAQAARVPHEPAVLFENERLTYREMNQQANRLAHHLLSLGLGAETRVALCLGNTPQMVVSILAILKAGAAYVPLDPAYPAERLTFMLADSAAPVLITDRSFRDRLPPYTGRVIDLDADRETLRGRDDVKPVPAVSLENAAYVIYTSGSTGRPKGVIVTRRNLEHSIQARLHYYRQAPVRSFLSFFSFAFDGSVTGLFWTLVQGGCLILPPAEAQPSLLRITGLLAEHRTSHLLCLPSLYHLLLSQIRPAFLPALKVVVVAGEACRKEWVDQHYRLLPHAALYNEYGPTEAAVWSSVHACQPEEQGLRLPIGRPIAATRLYVLDENLRPVPMSVIGELYIGGSGLARGYLNNPDRTAECFGPDPFGPEPGGRLYRTGDEVRWLSEGNLEFIGRTDQQVKIRGFRVETAEIESWLARHAKIKEAAVISRQDPDGVSYLAAYFTAAEEVREEELKGFLGRQLPSYMIPSRFVCLERLPLTPAGKCDRRNLPEPEPRHSLKTGAEAPRDDLERKLAQIWQQVLDLESSDREQRFFDLGGHSLKALELAARIHKEWGVEITLEHLLNAPAFKDLADFVRQAAQTPYRPILPIPEKKVYEASPAQSRMFFLHELDPNGLQYNLPGAVRLEGPLDVGRMKSAFRALVQRHESLQTSFILQGEHVMQRIATDLGSEMEYWEAGETDIERTLDGLLRPFDLSRAPLIRAALIHTGPDRHYLFLDMHHIVADGRSLQVLLRDLGNFYQGLAPEPLKIQYKDFSARQRSLLSSESAAKQKEYWLQRLAGEIPSLNWPLETRRPAIRSFAGHSLCFTVPSGLTRMLKEQAAAHNGTLYMLLLAAYFVLIYKYTGQEDMVVGTPVAGRSHPDLETVCGLFVNTLALRQGFSSKTPFSVFLRQIKTTVLEALENQEFPFEELVKHLHLDRDLSRNPVFDTLFALQNLGEIALHLPGMQTHLFPLPAKIAKFDLALIVTETGDELLCEWEYAKRLFPAAAIGRLHGHFRRILETISQTPLIPLTEIEIIGPEETNRILYEFNATDQDYSIDRTVPELFEEQASRTPDHPALIFEGRSFTYCELNQRANQLARTLRNIAPESSGVIGLLLDRSPELIIAVLAVLKAGHICLALDPGQPQQRLTFMLADAEADLLLTSSRLAAEPLDFAGNKIEIDRPQAYAMETENPEPKNQRADLAFLVYTSGSTGRPKAVMLHHRGLINFIRDYQHRFQIRLADRIFQFANISFDAALSEIFMSLLCGATLYLSPSDTLTDTAKMEEFLNRHRISILTLPPSYLSLLEPCHLPSLRVLISAGSETNFSLVKKWGQTVSYYNAYGPTEGSIGASIYSIDPQTATRLEMLYASVPIGKPLTNVKILILDKYGHMQPIGVPGEICLAGPGLAAGYWRRPDLTNAKFITVDWEPLASIARRLYCTGDSGRWLADGNLEFLGRLDQQVKIRGYRIETGEIEAQLLKYVGLYEAVVVTRKDSENNPYLCAYYTAISRPNPEELREHLTSRLPRYMIPSYFMRLDKLPLTSHGKLDRRALPEPDRASGLADLEKPETATERRLAAIWAQALGLEAVGIGRNFFDLGGHSLKAIEIITRIRREMGLEIPLETIFNHPTVKALAARLPEAKQTTLPSILRTAPAEFYAASAAQSRMFVLSRFEGANVGYNISGAALLEGPIDKDRLQECFQRLVQRHESLRTSFDMRNGEVLQKIHDRIPFSLEYLETTEKAAGERLDGFRQPFDLFRPPLLRAVLIKVGAQKHYLALDLHHIIADGLSMEILFRELSGLYRGTDLPSLKVQYKDFAAWQAALLKTDALKKQETYWMKYLEGDLPLLNLPLDYERPVVKNFSGAVVRLALDAETTAALRQTAAARGCTLYMLLSAAYAILMHKYTRQPEILIGSPVTGRSHPDLGGMVGLFVNTVVTRNRLAGRKPFDRFLEEVKTDTWRALENQDYPFDRLVNSLSLAKDINRNPVFDVFFSLQNMRDDPLQFPGVEIKTRDLHHSSATFDLSLTVLEAERQLICDWEYDTNLFKQSTVEAFSRHFIHIVQSGLNEPRTPLARMEILSPQEKSRIVREFNSTSADVPPDQTVVDLFEEWAAATPRRRAVSFEGRSLTYGALNRSANQLARHLNRLGVGPEELVGILLRKGPDLLIAVLAVLKAGAAYLPLDVNYPKDRLQFVLADTGVRTVISEAGLKDRIAAFEVRTVDMSEWKQFTAAENPNNPRNRIWPEQLAYVIYTSGSTGQPKGVMVQHHGLREVVAFYGEAYDAAADDRHLQMANFIFDVFTGDWVKALCSGAELLLVSKETVVDPRALYALIRKKKPTCAEFVPAVLRNLMDYLQKTSSTLASFRAIVVGSDSWHLADHVRTKRFCAKQTRLLNTYGTTETTIELTCYENKQGEEPARTYITPIGRPRANYCAYILDEYRQPVPIGVAGHLYIGGAGVSRGYLKRPELTAEKFVPDPFSPIPGSRLYDTQDLARYLSDGNMEFIGRLDHQVKIRGLRIELGEIEMTLKQHPGVHTAVVMAREDRPGENRLTAYVVPAAGQSPDSRALTSFLKTKLPEYMVPALFVFLKTLPLSANGKVDRRALPAPDRYVSAADPSPAVPLTGLEKTLAGIWSQVLGIKDPGIHDNFFALGGHSLNVLHMIAKAEESGCKISLNDLYTFPTIRELALHLQDREEAETIIKDFDQARIFFKEHFRAEFKTTRPASRGSRENPEYELLYDDAKTGREAILAAVQSRLAQDLYPHTISGKRPKNRPPRAGQRLSPALLRTIALEFEALNDRLARAIFQSPVQKQYPLGPAQKNHLKHPDLFARTILTFDDYLDLELFGAAFTRLVRMQGLLHSRLARKKGRFLWTEHGPAERLPLPVIDLSDRRFTDRDFDRLKEKLFFTSFRKDGLSYRLVLLKRDLRRHYLVLVCHHLIFDKASMEIVKRDWLVLYRDLTIGRSRPLQKPKSYAEYIRTIERGANRLAPAEMIRAFHLEPLALSAKTLQATVKPSQRPLLFRHVMSLDRRLTETRPWETAFMVFILFLKNYLGMSRLPVWLVYNNRLPFGFANTIGEFLDLVPLFIDLEDKHIDPVQASLSKVTLTAKHQIHFMDILLNRSQDRRWKSVARLLQSAFSASSLLFNFIGPLEDPEAEKMFLHALAKKEKRSPAFNPLDQGYGLLMDIEYTTGALHFTLACSLGTRIRKLQSALHNAQKEVERGLE